MDAPNPQPPSRAGKGAFHVPVLEEQGTGDRATLKRRAQAEKPGLPG